MPRTDKDNCLYYVRYWYARNVGPPYQLIHAHRIDNMFSHKLFNFILTVGDSIEGLEFVAYA
jgi:hypothetical protein